MTERHTKTDRHRQVETDGQTDTERPLYGHRETERLTDSQTDSDKPGEWILAKKNHDAAAFLRIALKWANLISKCRDGNKHLNSTPPPILFRQRHLTYGKESTMEC